LPTLIVFDVDPHRDFVGRFRFEPYRAGEREEEGTR